MSHHEQQPNRRRRHHRDRHRDRCHGIRGWSQSIVGVLGHEHEVKWRLVIHLHTCPVIVDAEASDEWEAGHGRHDRTHASHANGVLLNSFLKPRAGHRARSPSGPQPSAHTLPNLRPTRFPTSGLSPRPTRFPTSVLGPQGPPYLIPHAPYLKAQSSRTSVLGPDASLPRPSGPALPHSTRSLPQGSVLTHLSPRPSRAHTF